MPKISIITVAYNNKNGLEKTIESVVNQTYRDFEYIIIDGGSTDGSKELLEKHQDHITYWVSEPDKGIYNAMNKGIKVAKGEYLLFLNSGDFLFDHAIFSTISNRLITNKDIYYGNLEYFDEDKKWTQKFSKELNFKYLIEQFLPHPAAFCKKELFIKNNFDEKYKICADWKFFLQSIVKNDATYEYMDEVVTSYDFSGLSSNPDNLKTIIEEKKLIVDALFLNASTLFEEKNLLKKRLDAITNHPLYVILKKIKYKFSK